MEVSPQPLHAHTPWCWCWPVDWDIQDIPLAALDILDIQLAAEAELPGLDKEERAGGYKDEYCPLNTGTQTYLLGRGRVAGISRLIIGISSGLIRRGTTHH